MMKKLLGTAVLLLLVSPILFAQLTPEETRSLRDQIRSLEKELSDDEKKVRTLQNKINDNSVKIAEAERAHSTKAAVAGEKRSELSDINPEGTAARISQLESDIKDLDKENAKLSKSIAKKQGEIAKIQAELAPLQANLDQNNERINAHKTEITERKAILSNTDIKGMQKEISKAEKTADKQLSETNKLQNQNVLWQSEIDAIQREIQRKRDVIAEKQRQMRQ